MTRIVHANAVLTGDAGEIRDGAVVVAADGTITDVGRAADVLPAHAGLEVERVHGVVFPGLVNAHTHIELSAYRGRVAGGQGFLDWVDRFIALRAATPHDEEAEAIAQAVADLDAYATAAVGDITNSLAAVGPLARAGIGGSVFHEVFGLRRDQAMARVDALAREVEEKVGAWPSADLVYAPAPHTLYTTHADAVAALLKGAKARNAVSSLHFAEHAAERRAIEEGDGPIVPWLEGRIRVPQAEQAWPKRPLLDYATSLGAVDARVLLVHLTTAREAELAVLAERGAPVVLCPRSNLYIETKLPPLLAMRSAGVAPALGTDSLASNASLDVLAEARALADRFPGVPAVELVQMATWNGARALARTDLGRIAKGARPGIAAIEGDSGADASAFLLRNVKSPRRWVARRAERGDRP
jgi:cytosine/adenosine deaminase-related metal-dependent hydrolase